MSELRQEYPFRECLEVVGIARSTYYYHVKAAKKADKYAIIKEKICKIWENASGRYGYRRIYAKLRQDGTIINHKTVQRLMKILGFKCMVRLKKYKSYRGEQGKSVPNILNRDFKATKPYEKLVTDITEFKLHEEKLYLSTLQDLYNGEIVSYSVGKHPNFYLVRSMLEKALEIIPDTKGMIIHSDQGWHYQQKRYQEILAERGIIQSMSRKGNCLDNAVMENFFGHLKSELLYIQKFSSMEHFIDELYTYIHWYNYERIKLNLNGLSPVSYRLKAA